MLFWLDAADARAAWLSAAVCTPGVNAMRLVKLPWLIGRFSTCSVVIGERALAALRLDQRRFGGDVDRFGRAADFERERRDRRRGRRR